MSVESFNQVPANDNSNEKEFSAWLDGFAHDMARTESYQESQTRLESLLKKAELYAHSPGKDPRLVQRFSDDIDSLCASIMQSADTIPFATLDAVRDVKEGLRQ